jgi:hypothetical protein
MSLIHFDGFDARASILSGAYSYPVGSPATNASYVTGRFGTGFAIKGAQTTSGPFELTHVFSGAARTAVVTGASIFNGAGYTYSATLFAFRAGAGATSEVLTLRVNPTGYSPAGRLSVNRGLHTQTGTELGVSAVTVPSDAWHRIEVKVIAGTGTAGTVIVRQNGVVTLNLPGVDTGSANLTGVGLGFANEQNYCWAQTSDDWWICDTSGTVNNDFLGDVRVLGISPSGNGTYSQLTGSDGNSVDNYALVDEVPPDTVDFVGSPTAGQKDTYQYADIPASYTVRGVRVAALASKSDAGQISGRILTRSGTTDAGGPDCALTSTPTLFSTVLENDPATSAAWTSGGLNAAEFGWEVRP